MSKSFLFKILRVLFLIITVFISYLLIQYTFPILYPILVAMVMSYLINPFVNLLENKLKFPRPVAAITVISTMFGIVISAIFLIVAEVIQGTAYLANKIPEQFHAFITYMEDFFNTTILPIYEKLLSFFHTLDPSQQLNIQEHIQQLASHIATTGATFLQDFLLKIPDFITMLPNSLTVFVFIVLATFLITNDWYRLEKSTKKIIPSSVKTSTGHVLKHLKKAMFGFAKAQLILISITAGIIFIGLLFFQVEHALTIALLASAADLLPYVGTGIIFIPWIIYLFITGEYSMTISLILLYMFIIVLRQILEPKILSTSIGLHPLAALVALFIGLQLWGFIGIIVAPILLVVLNAFHQAGVTKQLWLFIKG
ncbi:sporulation integral membrane protein YtvI [Virgibacillus sp. NKC19-16]|uniref:sporulation integral membrane protein YtvI n=1 Tax=Virgibacillus salidurans TaxID=2831673 RepID=UPI001F1ED5A2|nr:sporulation integral membrane protein YtvI [Virgibacillus sp. NKC19-16]UJL45043.1 sporulation integral membrane protein YtvI [Virgibacillus sp. NKC19-16]